uniref:Protein kinase domain-containing protein n=1 Tax=Glossina palpalis gambiensis TaxID=67801 RepID=A0A1B0BEB2_9MUSC
MLTNNTKMSALLRTPQDEAVLILSSPKRREILKEGPPQNIRNNILGKGAYGTVIKAVYKAKPVAVKIVKNLGDCNHQTMRNESHVLGWKHANIVRIFKVEITMNFAIVIMERFLGHSLQKILDCMELPLKHRVYIGLDVLAALMYCHKRNLLHMDVKPKNVMITWGNNNENWSNKCYTCKLCDFGSSVKITEQTTAVKGIIKGTVRYMAPEALKEEYLHSSADIYSLGMTLWQMKYRHLPYDWLECNEIVAYQVVKNNLRPTACSSQKAANNNNQAIVPSSRQSCYSKTLVDVSKNSLKNVQNILKPPKTTLTSSKGNFDGNHSQKSIRKPFEDLNIVAKSSENVKCNVSRANRMYPDTMFQIGDEAIYVDPIKEQKYDDLYIKCWDNDCSRRPSGKDLRRDLKELL